MIELFLAALRGIGLILVLPVSMIALYFGGVRYRHTGRTGWPLIRDVLMGPVLCAVVAAVLLAGVATWWIITHVPAPD